MLSGIRVYMEGFKLPHTESPLTIGSTWFKHSIRGPRTARRLDEVSRILARGRPAEGGLFVRPNQTYSGAVFLRNDTSPGLEMLVNREGFLPGPALHALRHIIESGRGHSNSPSIRGHGDRFRGARRGCGGDSNWSRRRQILTDAFLARLGHEIRRDCRDRSFGREAGNRRRSIQAGGHSHGKAGPATS